jgi:valyl-tRNA synthetase
MEKGLNIPTVYDPKAVEEKWYKHWLEEEYFTVKPEQNKPAYSIVIPPPNVTGSLHMGHALNGSLQDIIIRRKRMQGYNALWVPGTDHAGIATQNVVEKQLAGEGLTRYDLGRDKFIDRVWQWKEQYGGTIINQLKKLGASCDWSRERFTMDEGCSAAVKEVFVQLYEKGLIYRDNYIINWCPRCSTALSDIEVEHLDEQGKLYQIRYPVKDSEEFVVVATTRPETMLGDVAVAVHPEDERYKQLIGKTLILPIIGRELEIIADEYVDQEFGTGAVKITPAHDPNDFEIGLRHNLEQIVVMNGDATMNEKAGKYEGLDRYTCRKMILEDLRDQGYLFGIVDHDHAIGHCSRCDHVIEPILSKQWFVRMKPLAEPAIAAVKEGKIKFVPERFTKTYLDWVENVRDWCISRQIWWGHRIPVWYCEHCGEVMASKTEVESCKKCGSSDVYQDPDVLDTWFSSALWPFSTMGWPEKTKELELFYPTSLLATGYDIIYFWVARMIFMGLEFMGEIPFKEVYINGLVRDASGKKMSKSRGNTVDPLEKIEQYGADTLRFTLITNSVPGSDMRLHEEKFEASRNFANKIWNASRFVLMNLEDFDPQLHVPEQVKLDLADCWIVSRFNKTVKEINRWLDQYNMSEAGKVLYDFIWSEFCDWYIELVKPRLYNNTDSTDRWVAQYCLSTVLRETLQLLHPFMPFITEEIWQHLPHEGESIVLAPWPNVRDELIDSEAEDQIGLMQEIVRIIRNIRAEMQVVPSKKIEVYIQANSVEALKRLEHSKNYLKNLVNLEGLILEEKLKEKPEQSVTGIASGIEIFLPLKGLIDVEKELARLGKDLELVKKEIERAEGKLNNQGFMAKAPEQVVAKEREKLSDYLDKRDKIEEQLEMVKKL